MILHGLWELHGRYVHQLLPVCCPDRAGAPTLGTTIGVVYLQRPASMDLKIGDQRFFLSRWRPLVTTDACDQPTRASAGGTSPCVRLGTPGGEPPRVSPEAWLLESTSVAGVLLSVECGLELGWRDVADGRQEPAVVEPVDPFQSGVLDLVDPLPMPAPADQLGLVQADDAVNKLGTLEDRREAAGYCFVSAWARMIELPSEPQPGRQAAMPVDGILASRKPPLWPVSPNQTVKPFSNESVAGPVDSKTRVGAGGAIR
jgi:hypothetical protein